MSYMTYYWTNVRSSQCTIPYYYNIIRPGDTSNIFAGSQEARRTWEDQEHCSCDPFDQEMSSECSEPPQSGPSHHQTEFWKSEKSWKSKIFKMSKIFLKLNCVLITFLWSRGAGNEASRINIGRIVFFAQKRVFFKKWTQICIFCTSSSWTDSCI